MANEPVAINARLKTAIGGTCMAIPAVTARKQANRATPAITFLVLVRSERSSAYPQYMPPQKLDIPLR